MPVTQTSGPQLFLVSATQDGVVIKPDGPTVHQIWMAEDQNSYPIAWVGIGGLTTAGNLQVTNASLTGLIHEFGYEGNNNGRVRFFVDTDHEVTVYEDGSIRVCPDGVRMWSGPDPTRYSGTEGDLFFAKPGKPYWLYRWESGAWQPKL
jgi:hypothetical protein